MLVLRSKKQVSATKNHRLSVKMALFNVKNRHKLLFLPFQT